MSQTVRAGFIGCGPHATYAIWPCLRDASIEIAYACDVVAERAEANRARFGADRATTELRQVLEDDAVQAVFVVGPPALHHEVGLQGLECGKHVFIEKPAGVSAAQAHELQAAAERNRVVCQVGYQKRFALAYQEARAAALDPEFGGIRLCKINYSHWRQPDWSSHLIYMSVHPLDLVRWFMGDPVEAWLLKQSFDDGRGNCVLTLLYESGAGAVVNMSANEPHVQEWLELSGANRLISVRNLVDYRELIAGSDPDPDLRDTTERTWQPDFGLAGRLADSRELQGYAGEIREFARAIREGGPVSPSIADAVATMRYADAIAAAPDGMSKLSLER